MSYNESIPIKSTYITFQGKAAEKVCHELVTKQRDEENVNTRVNVL